MKHVIQKISQNERDFDRLFIEEFDITRAPHRLRPNRYAQIQKTEKRRSLVSTEHNPKRQKTRKTHAVIAPMRPVNSARKGRDKASLLVKSP